MKRNKAGNLILRLAMQIVEEDSANSEAAI